MIRNATRIATPNQSHVIKYEAFQLGDLNAPSIHQ